MQVRIYQPYQSPMQAGPGRSAWILKFLPSNSHEQFLDSVCGYTGTTNTQTTTKLTFQNLKQAVTFAKNHQLVYEIIYTQKRKIIKKSYADNFK